MVAVVIEHSQLHRRISLAILHKVGTNPRLLMLGELFPDILLVNNIYMYVNCEIGTINVQTTQLLLLRSTICASFYCLFPLPLLFSGRFTLVDIPYRVCMHICFSMSCQLLSRDWVLKYVVETGQNPRLSVAGHKGMKNPLRFSRYYSFVLLEYFVAGERNATSYIQDISTGSGLSGCNGDSC